MTLRRPSSQLDIFILHTVGIQDLTAECIFTALKETLERYGVPLCNVLSFTCNVMKGARGGVIAKLRTLQPKIIDIHSVYLPFNEPLCKSSC